MSDRIRTRMGDGELVTMSSAEIREDILAGTEVAARKGKVDQLSQTDRETLFEIIAARTRTVSVEPGNEVVVTDDGCSMAFYGGQDSSGVGVPLSRLQAILAYERACAADTTSMGHSDYSFKPIKPIINYETSDYYNASMQTTAPFLYGAQPNMGLIFNPTAPTAIRPICCPRERSMRPSKSRRRPPGTCAGTWSIALKNSMPSAAKGSTSTRADQPGMPIFWRPLRPSRNCKRRRHQMPIIMGGVR